MKYTKVIVILLLLLQSLTISAIGISQEKNESTMSFFIDTSEPIISYQDSFSTIHIKEADSYYSLPGHPSLPVIKETHILPYKTTVNSITFIENVKEKIIINKPLQPTEQPQPTSYQNSNVIYEPNEKIYSKDVLFPPKQYDVQIGTGLYEEQLVQFITITYYPVQYNPQQNTIYWTKQSWINITYEEPANPVPLINEYDLAIIAPQQFQSIIQDLVNHKNSNGINTIYKSTEEIYSEYQGRDAAEQIKYYIYEMVESFGIKNVLLIGNVDLTPMRRADIKVYHDTDILTDLYYADVLDALGQFSDWDSNNNDRFSEYNWDVGCIDQVDAYPDIHVGRLPCKNIEEVETVINKIITYETKSAHEPWYNRMLLLAGDTFPNHGVIEGELVTSIIGEHMEQEGFELIKLWTSKNTFKPMNINKEINKGAGFISYSGHGYEQGFGTSPPNEDKRVEYYSPYLYGMFNGDKLPVIFFDACSTTKLDFTVEDLLEWYPQPIPIFLTLIEGEPYKMDSYYPCFSWELVKKQNGGGIATIGATRVAFTGVGQDGAHWGAGLLNTRFFEHYTDGKSLGELFTSCQIDYLNMVGKEFITLEEFNLIGDPSLSLGGI